jgi:PhzF family phenazine biosynthesis protein
MTQTLRAFHVDAFTSVRGGGNPAVVALDAGHLDAAQMQRLASEHHDGDWAFVLPASGNDADLDVRFFSPRKELPFVGHATLALHAVLARFEPRELRRQRGSTGIVEVRRSGEGLFSIRQAAPALGRYIDAIELREVLSLLGLASAQLDARAARRASLVVPARDCCWGSPILRRSMPSCRDCRSSLRCRHDLARRATSRSC